ncbi:MAG: hypothetical protein PHC84_00765, partial [Clostridia bacterium]|nr:hypothetical protein [Clostridia bacterium]
MSETNTTKKTEGPEIIITRIKEYENRVVCSYLSRIKEKRALLDKKRIELTIKRELFLRAEEEKLRKAEMAARPQNAQEQISVEAGGQDNETAAQERSEDEKAIVAQSTENIVPLVTEPATVRRVEPVRTAEKPVVKTGEKTEEKTATD